MIDVQEAKRFLSALSSIDGSEIFSFQTFVDEKGLEHAVKEERSKELTRTLHGRFDNLADQLVALNQKGAGVFVCVNRTNGMGIRGKDVDRIRSFFVDDDSDHLSPEDFPVPPSMIVRTKRGAHFYWLTSNGLDKSHFGPTQKALAERYGTDPSVFNLNRVMRIPGFMHNKGDPFLVTIEHLNTDASYELDDIAVPLGLDIKKHEWQPPRHVDDKSLEGVSMDRRRQRAAAMLRAIGPAVRDSGEGHAKTMSACRVGNDFAIPDFEFLSLLQGWGASCDPPWDEQQLQTFYFSTLPSIDNARFPWGGKLLDDQYANSRPAGVTPATPYRGGDVPWAPAGAAPQREARVDSLPPSVEVAEQDVPAWMDVPSSGVRPTSNRRIVSSPALPQSEVVMSAGDRELARRQRIEGQHRIGVPVEDSDGFLQYSDEHRQPKEAASRLRDEYEFRRDDSRCVYIYEKNCWHETSKEFIEKLAAQYMTFNEVCMKDITEATRLALNKNHVKQIRWNQVGDTEVPVGNGVLNFMTGELREHRSSDYLDRLTPVEYEPEARCELWEKCLDEWLPDMPEEREALQQFFGYILMPHANYKKAAILFGAPDTGKSQVCNIAVALVGGVGNTCAIAPDDMDDPRKLAPIKGKALNCVADLKKSTVLADGGFKQLVSAGDAIQIDQKYTRSEMYTPTAKHLFATNNLPTIRDVTDAVFRRIMILGFNQRVPLAKQDPTLEGRLKKELPGILNWAVEGAKKLYTANGRWPVIKSSNALLAEYKLVQNPLHFFIKESGDVTPTQDGFVKTEELRNKMNEFNGGSKPYGRRGFTKLVDSLSEDFPGLERKKKSGQSIVAGLSWSGGQQDLDLPS